MYTCKRCRGGAAYSAAQLVRSSPARLTTNTALRQLAWQIGQPTPELRDGNGVLVASNDKWAK